MATKHLTLRMDAAALERLERESERTGQNRSELARQLIEEGLRMARHPGIVFRDGAAERTAVVKGGPRVWVVARVLREQTGSLDDIVRATAELMEQPEHLVRDAALYYLEFREEVDAWLQSLDREAEAAEDEWLRNRERVSA